jgi:hypothetical protein
MISAAKYRIITEMNDLTSETEKKITDANVWASIIRTGAVKPTEGEIGALISHTWKNMMDEVDARIAEQQAIFKKELDIERQERVQADLIIASQVAKINNLLREKDIIQTERDRLDDAHSILHYCQVCFERARDIRFDPCELTFFILGKLNIFTNCHWFSLDLIAVNMMHDNQLRYHIILM